MELNHLRYFKEVARTENISQAAKALYITQPALSATIKRLEGELGFSLFVRNGNSIKLTEAGRCFLSYVNSVFSLLQEGETKARKIANQDNSTLKVASGFGVLRDMTRDYLETCPDFKLELRCMPTDDILTRLSNGKADIGYVLGDDQDSRYNSRVIMTGTYYICVNKEHPLAQYMDSGLHMSDLEGQLVFCSNIARTYSTINRIMAQSSVTFNLLMLDEKDVLFQAAKKGLGAVFCMPMFDVNPTTTPEEEPLLFIPILDCPECGKVVMLRPKEVYYSEEQEQYLRYIEYRFSLNENRIRDDWAARHQPLPGYFQPY